MPWPIIAALSALIALALGIRLALVYRAMREICDEMDARLSEETNVLISTASGDRRVRRMAARMNAQLRALRAARRELRRGNLSLRENVTGISHDLRTPLTAICGYLELLEREALGENARRYVNIISGRAQAMRDLTEELFRYTVAGVEPQPLEIERVNLGGALEEALLAQFSTLAARGIEPVLRAPDAPVFAQLSRAGIARVFGNILSNVSKYAEGALEIELSEAGALKFINAAPMLDEVRVGKLFDRFYTVESGRNGTGLGLSIARALTERMGGSIDARLHEGKLELELDFRAAVARAAAKPEAADIGAGKGAPAPRSASKPEAAEANAGEKSSAMESDGVPAHAPERNGAPALETTDMRAGERASGVETTDMRAGERAVAPEAAAGFKESAARTREGAEA